MLQGEFEDRCTKNDAIDCFIFMMEHTKIGLWKEASSLQPDPSPVDVGTQLSHGENKKTSS